MPVEQAWITDVHGNKRPLTSVEAQHWYDLAHQIHQVQQMAPHTNVPPLSEQALFRLILERAVCLADSTGRTCARCTEDKMYVCDFLRHMLAKMTH